MTTERFAAVMLFGLAGCGEPAGSGGPPPEIVAFVDTNPADDIVEVQLIAEPAVHEYLPGKPAEVWAFRDGAGAGGATIPGPLLEANLGDQVIVHFENRLPEGTTIHWHGLRLENAADGTPSSQMIVPPGGTFDYEFEVIDAGLFWYHPHVEGDVQVEAGLYAPIVVHGGPTIDVTADRVFVLDDVKVEATGLLSTTTVALDIMLGRQGNVLLVNGERELGFTTSDGARERWRFVNAANGRYFNLELPGHSFMVIGWDGGMLPEPYMSDTLLVAPGERYEVLVELDATDDLALQTIFYDRGHDIVDEGPRDLIQIGFEGEAAELDPLPSAGGWGEVEAIPFDVDTPRRPFVLREVEGGPEVIFTINDEAFPEITPIMGVSGDIEVWEIDNQSEMDHPFHLHGMSFQVLDEAGTGLAAPLGWKDTVNVPLDQTVRFAVRFGNAGRWMYHCHILEHAERGMMGELELVP